MKGFKLSFKHDHLAQRLRPEPLKPQLQLPCRWRLGLGSVHLYEISNRGRSCGNSRQRGPVEHQMSTGTSCWSLRPAYPPSLHASSSCVFSKLTFLRDRATPLSSPVPIWGQDDLAKKKKHITAILFWVMQWYSISARLLLTNQKTLWCEKHHSADINLTEVKHQFQTSLSIPPLSHLHKRHKGVL